MASKLVIEKEESCKVDPGPMLKVLHATDSRFRDSVNCKNFRRSIDCRSTMAICLQRRHVREENGYTDESVQV